MIAVGCRHTAAYIDISGTGAFSEHASCSYALPVINSLSLSIRLLGYRTDAWLNIPATYVWNAPGVLLRRKESGRMFK
jgi:hypothetical protein